MPEWLDSVTFVIGVSAWVYFLVKTPKGSPTAWGIFGAGAMAIAAL